MGWTSYHAKYYKNGKVDRKAECISELEEGGYYTVLKSTMTGSTFYAAVKNKHTEEVFGVVFLTSTDSKDYYNFSYKDMDDTMEPYYYDCPESILKLLTPTENECANKWRERCHQRNKEKKNTSLASLPIGTVIKVKIGNREVELTKEAPAYQFKTPFWLDYETFTYVPKTKIRDYEIIEEGK